MIPALYFYLLNEPGRQLPARRSDSESEYDLSIDEL